MVSDGDDAGRCSNGLTAQRFREATAEERATYRRWLRGTIAFYVVVLAISGAIAVANYSGIGLTQIADLAARQVVQPPR
jgi:hypothetical protein